MGKSGAGYGWEVVSPRGDGEKSGIVSFRREGLDPSRCVEALVESGIFLAARRGCLRASPHFYNRPEQLDALIEALARA